MFIQTFMRVLWCIAVGSLCWISIEKKDPNLKWESKANELVISYGNDWMGCFCNDSLIERRASSLWSDGAPTKGDLFFFYLTFFSFFFASQDQRRVRARETGEPVADRDAGRGRLRPRRAGQDRLGRVADVRPEEDEEVADRRDAPAAAHHVREGDHGGGQLRLHRQALPHLQGHALPLHAHGVVPRRRTLDHPQVPVR